MIDCNHFSKQSELYRQFRPTYPQALFAYLTSLTNTHQTAWDCATGNGQVAGALARNFDTVVATDVSLNQIKNAVVKPNIAYQVCASEKSHLSAESVDLITVAQALHWFDIEAFSQEAIRVMKSKAVMAVWMYNLLSVSTEVDAIIKHIYHNELQPYWAQERQMVDNNYQEVDFALPRINKIPEFSMSAFWHFEDLIGYLKTWSAVKTQAQITGSNIIDQYFLQLQKAWGNTDNRRTVTWPLVVKIWRKD